MKNKGVGLLYKITEEKKEIGINMIEGIVYCVDLRRVI